MTLDELLKAHKNPLSGDGRRLVTQAYEVAVKAHAGQKRKSGEDYVEHSLAAAKILAQMGMDPETVAAGILHDVPEDTIITLDEIKGTFGPQVANLVDGVTKLGKLRLKGSREENYMENLRKMFFAMAEDIRVIIIKLADRLHNMRTLSALPHDKQLKIARETMEIYAPIANRLGIGEIKGELEDLAFKYLEPAAYDETVRLMQDYADESQQYIEEGIQALRAALKEENIQSLDIHGRTKNIYRLYHKLKKHDMDINRVYDLFAIRIIVPSVADCYEALGVIHKRYRPMVGRIKDYISLPKPNGYQSLHTTIFGPKGRIVEVQIRTKKMHDEAEFGIAAHWLYTENERSIWQRFFVRPKAAEGPAARDVAWIKQLSSWQHEIGRDTSEFMQGLQIEFFKNHIFCFTPKGDIIQLPEEATPVDFAYAIHSEIGDTAVGAKADGKMVALDAALQNGQVVEIMVDKNRKKPNPDWLSFAKTSTAKSHIRHALKREE